MVQYHLPYFAMADMIGHYLIVYNLQDFYLEMGHSGSWPLWILQEEMRFSALMVQHNIIACAYNPSNELPPALCLCTSVHVPRCIIP